MFFVHWVHLATGIPRRPAQIESRLSPAWTRRDDGLDEGHSGGFRIEPLRPDGARVGFRLVEVRPSAICALDHRSADAVEALGGMDGQATSPIGRLPS